MRWGRLVSSYAIDDGGLLLLFDPIDPPSEIIELAAGRETAIVLTCPWHERGARSLVERFGWPLFAAWLLVEDTGERQLYAAGDPLPGGLDAFRGWEH